MPKQVLTFLVILLFVLTSCLPEPSTSEPVQPPSIDPVTESPSLSETTQPNSVNPGAESLSSSETTQPSNSSSASEISSLLGRVISIDGQPISGAKVSNNTFTVTTIEDGTFSLPGDGTSQWVTVKAAGFISRTRAASSEQQTLFRLSPDDGQTIVLHFAGDTMFGRRFFDANEDGDLSDGLLPINPTTEDHLKLLKPIQPLIEIADITVLNLEGPLSDQAYIAPGDERPLAFHTTKDYVFASDPDATIALKQVGVDVVGIGNNHTYDTLETGLVNTLSVLSETELVAFGAGENESSAWQPAVTQVNGQNIAFIGCTTIWSASNLGPEENSVSYIASDASEKGGAAACKEIPLKNAIETAKKQADLVVVMIHGGTEYNRTQSEIVQKYSEMAKQTGADLVINHHPHVVGGLAWNTPTLTAWSLGNFVFDQSVWPTLESYMLAVYVRNGEVVRAYIEPLMLQNFVAHGITANLGDFVVRGAAGRSDSAFVMESNALELDINQQAIEQTTSVTVQGAGDLGEIVAIPEAQWLSGSTGNGSVLLGRDLLWIGGFEKNAIVETSADVPLWDMGSDGFDSGSEFAFEGDTGIQLSRGSSNIKDAVTSPLHRIPIIPGTKITITGMMRASVPAPMSVQLSWYDQMKGSSFSQSTEIFTAKTADEWVPFRFDATVPEGSIAIGLYLRLPPPTTGSVKMDFDNIRMIEWAAPDAIFSPLYNFAMVTGNSDLIFTQQVLPGAESLFTNP